MKTTKRAGIAAALIAPALVATGLVIGAGPVQAAYAPIKSFANCTAMHKVSAFRGGIKRVGAHDRRASGVARYRPYVSTRGYNLNSASDRDHDGVACEQ